MTQDAGGLAVTRRRALATTVAPIALAMVPEASFKQAMLRAKSVAMSTSTSGTYLTTRLFPQLGIAAEMAGKISNSRDQQTRNGAAETPVRAGGST